MNFLKHVIHRWFGVFKEVDEKGEKASE